MIKKVNRKSSQKKENNTPDKRPIINKGIEQNELLPVQKTENISSKSPSYENYNFFDLNFRSRILCFLFLKHHNFLLISSHTELMLLTPDTLDRLDKLIMTRDNTCEDINQVIELYDGNLLVASDKNLYRFSINEDIEIVDEDQANPNVKQRCLGLAETHNKNILDFREVYITYYDKDDFSIIQRINQFVSFCFFFPQLNYGITTTRSYFVLYDLDDISNSIKRGEYDSCEFVRGLLISEEKRNFLIYYEKGISYYVIKENLIKWILESEDKAINFKTNIKTKDGINFVQKLEYKDYIAVSVKDRTINIYDLSDGTFLLLHTIKVGRLKIPILHEVLENRFVFNIEKEKFALVDYITGKIIYYKNVPFAKDYRVSILLRDGRLLSGCWSRFITIK